MNRREVQKEFFQEFSEPGKRIRKTFDTSAVRRTYNLRLATEHIIFVFIGLIVLLVICFSLGVEKGKRTALAKIVAFDRLEKTAFKQEAEYDDIHESAEPEVVKQKQAVITSDSLYLIQVAAFRNNDQANKESEALNAQGYKTQIRNSGNYYIVSVAGFNTKDQAQQSYAALKKKYNDCFIRKIKQ